MVAVQWHAHRKGRDPLPGWKELSSRPSGVDNGAIPHRNRQGSTEGEGFNRVSVHMHV